MRVWAARVLGAVGAIIVILGAWSVVAGEAGLGSASPEVDSGPPARIFGALQALVGAVVIGGAWLMGRGKSSPR